MFNLLSVIQKNINTSINYFRFTIYAEVNILFVFQAIVMYLHSLPTNKKNVPELIRDPIALITDVRTLVGLHRHDDKDLAITGASVLQST